MLLNLTVPELIQWKECFGCKRMPLKDGTCCSVWEKAKKCKNRKARDKIEKMINDYQVAQIMKESKDE